MHSPHQRGLNRPLTARKLDPATHGFGRRRAVRYGLVGAIVFLRERGLFVWCRAFRAASRLETDSIWNDRARVRNRPTLDSHRRSSHAWRSESESDRTRYARRPDLPSFVVLPPRRFNKVLAQPVAFASPSEHRERGISPESFAATHVVFALTAIVK